MCIVIPLQYKKSDYFLFLNLKNIKTMNFDRLEDSLEKWFDLLILKIPSVLVGIVIFIIGRYVIKLTLRLIDRRFHRRNVDMSIRSFIESIVRFALYALLILTVASTMGIQTTSFIAVLSAFGLAVGMALQGSLSNFAGGVLILLFRPFEVGDWISSANGSQGTVDSIDILYTTLIDDDGVRVFSPNGTLANSVIRNTTKITNRRFQFSFLISYNTDVKDARKSILGILNAHPNVLKEPAPNVYIGDLTDGGMQLVVRGWATRKDQFSTRNSLAESIKEVLDGKIVVLPQSSIKILKDEG